MRCGRCRAPRLLPEPCISSVPGCPLLPRRNLPVLGRSRCAVMGVRRVSSPCAGLRTGSDLVKSHFGKKRSDPRVREPGEPARSAVRWLPLLLPVPKPLLRGAWPHREQPFHPRGEGRTDRRPRCGRAVLGKEVESGASSGPPAWETPVACAGIAEVEVRGGSWGSWTLSPSFGPGSPALCGRSCLQPAGSRGSAAGELARRGVRNSL